ncbi:MAG: diphosphomevalonate decarboxylase [Polyangiaceae bacterium]|nr:diphosphomevalonate decarboxylase [Polyangiaceae bacterium]
MLLGYRRNKPRQTGESCLTTLTARTVAHANIALAKYWGKHDSARNLTAVPSLSLTLDRLRTETDILFDAGLAQDEASIDDEPLYGRPLERVVALIDQLRAMAGVTLCARVTSTNSFPTASGLASSASGFAALVLAGSKALGLSLSLPELSALARGASASAARSLFGGFVALEAGAEAAVPVAPRDHWDVVMLVAVVTRATKGVASTEGMGHTARTSPYYRAWVDSAPEVFQEVRRAVQERNLEVLGEAMEHSALLMHACMLASRPSLFYLTPSTLVVLDAVRSLRNAGVSAYFTMDAGPHVKVLTLPVHAEQVAHTLEVLPGVVEVLSCRPGPAAHEASADTQP